MHIGHTCGRDGATKFTVWAPRAEEVSLHIVAPADQLVPMRRDPRGYWDVTVNDAGPGTRYYYRLNGETDRPDPASHCQPEGVHGSSEVVDHSRFNWRDEEFSPPPLAEYIIYELHIGTFTEEGTFEAAATHLQELAELGVNAVEIMPVAAFPGERNWGYDGVYPFAVQSSYGGVHGLKHFVDACHRAGMAVILDVVYNHFGPEGNYAAEFGPYFTGKYNTPWGKAVNFDDAESDEVREYFTANALHWIDRFHVDALRLDAVHAIFDMSAVPFLRTLSERVEAYGRESGRSAYLIAESDLNDNVVVRERDHAGWGMDAQWSDDFHHSLHSLLTGERHGYYADFGTVEHLARAFKQTFVYSGQYSAHRRRSHGNSAEGIPASRFVVCSQNHDQVGNRMRGERLISLTDHATARLAASAVLLSPFIPLLFMGEEHGETAPFLYFVSHTDPAIVKATREGRAREFSAFFQKGTPPDPQDERTFAGSKIDRGERSRPAGAQMRACYRELIRVRRNQPALRTAGYSRLFAQPHGNVLAVHRTHAGESILLLLNVGTGSAEVDLEAASGAGSYRQLFSSDDVRWGGTGRSEVTDGVAVLAPRSALLLEKLQTNGKSSGGTA